MEVSLLDYVVCPGHGCILVLIFTFKRQVATYFKYSYPQSPPLCTHTVLARICPPTHLGHDIVVGQFFPVVYFNIGEERWDFTASGDFTGGISLPLVVVPIEECCRGCTSSSNCRWKRASCEDCD